MKLLACVGNARPRGSRDRRSSRRGATLGQIERGALLLASADAFNMLNPAVTAADLQDARNIARAQDSGLEQALSLLPSLPYAAPGPRPPATSTCRSPVGTASECWSRADGGAAG